MEKEKDSGDSLALIIFAIAFLLMLITSFVYTVIISFIAYYIKKYILKKYDKNIPYWLIPLGILLIGIIPIIFNFDILVNSYSKLASIIVTQIDYVKLNGFKGSVLIQLFLSINLSFNYLLLISSLILTTVLATRIEKLLNRFMFKKDFDKDKRDFKGTSNYDLIDYSYPKHLALFGTTGTGKGANLMWWGIHAFIKNKYLLFIDGKGGMNDFDSIPLLKGYANLFKKDLKIIDLDDYKNSSPFNPFKSLNSSTAIKDYLVTTIEWHGNQQYYKNNAERFWQVSAEVLLKHKEVLGQYLEEEGLTHIEFEGDLHFALIIHFFNTDNFIKLLEWLEENEKISMSEKDLYLSITEESSQGVNSSINQFATMYEGIGKYIFSHSKNAFDITDFINAQGNMVVAVRLNVQEYASFSQMIGRMMILECDRSTKLKQHNSATKDIEGIYIFDELRTYYTEKIIDILDKARNSKTKVVLTMLTPSDLGVEVANMVINLCDEIVCLRINNEEGAMLLSSSLGTYDTYYETIVIEKNHLLDYSMKAEGGSMRETKEYKLHPNQIKELKDLEFYYIIKSENSISEGITEFIPKDINKIKELLNEKTNA